MTEFPPLSVVMPARNAIPWLQDSLSSILDQTFSRFEFVILDDASTDGTREALRRAAARDSRIRLFESESRMGPVGSSNFIVAKARAQIVARMDADDIAHPDRLRRQFELMSASPEAVMVGSLSITIDGLGREVRPADYRQLLADSPFPPFNHPTTMFRKAAFTACGGYREGTENWEDCDLYRRMATEGRIFIIPDPLLSQRQTGSTGRFSDGRRALLKSIDRLYRCFDQRPEAEAIPIGKIHPEAFLSVGSSAVWAGRRPRLLACMLRNAKLAPNRRTAEILCWLTLSELSPGLTRSLLKWRLAFLNRRARSAIGDRRALEWRPSAWRGAGPHKVSSAGGPARTRPSTVASDQLRFRAEPETTAMTYLTSSTSR